MKTTYPTLYTYHSTSSTSKYITSVVAFALYIHAYIHNIHTCMLEGAPPARDSSAWSHPTVVGVALFGSNVSERLRSSREQLPLCMIILPLLYNGWL